MNERDPFAALDERMRQASAALRRAIESAVRDSASSSARTVDQSIAPGEALSVIEVDGQTPARPSQRRWLWIAAATLIVVAGVIGVLQLEGDDDDPTTAISGDQPLLLPGWLPTGWDLKAVERVTEPTEPQATAVVYAPGGVDPWTDDLITIFRSSTDMALTGPDAEQVRVSGLDATLERSSDTWLVETTLRGEAVAVTGRGVGRDTVLRVAAAAVDNEPVESVLPSGFAMIAAGPLDLASRLPTAGTSLAYGAASSAESVTINQRYGGESERGLIRMMLPATYTATEISVRGHRATLLTDEDSATDDRTIVEWFEAPGLLVTITANGLTNDQLTQLLGGLRPSTGAEIDALLATNPVPTTTDEGEQGREILVAEGDRASNHWRLSAIESDDLFEVGYEDERSSFGFGTAPGTDPAAPLEVLAQDQFDTRGDAAVVGIADVSITEAVVEADGLPSLSLEVHRHEQLSRAVIIGFVSQAYIGGEVVGRDSRGREVARVEMV